MQRERKESNRYDVGGTVMFIFCFNDNSEDKQVSDTDNDLLKKYYEKCSEANYLQSLLDRRISIFDDNYTLTKLSILFMDLRLKSIKIQADKDSVKDIELFYNRLVEIYREAFNQEEKNNKKLSFFKPYTEKEFDESEIPKIEEILSGGIK